MSGLVWMGYRRWLVRPWQCSLRDYLVIVALLRRRILVRLTNAPVIIFFAILKRSRFTPVFASGLGMDSRLRRNRDTPGDHPTDRRVPASGDGADKQAHNGLPVFPDTRARLVQIAYIWRGITDRDVLFNP